MDGDKDKLWGFIDLLASKDVTTPKDVVVSLRLAKKLIDSVVRYKKTLAKPELKTLDYLHEQIKSAMELVTLIPFEIKEEPFEPGADICCIL